MTERSANIYSKAEIIAGRLRGDCEGAEGQPCGAPATNLVTDLVATVPDQHTGVWMKAGATHRYCDAHTRPPVQPAEPLRP